MAPCMLSYHNVIFFFKGLKSAQSTTVCVCGNAEGKRPIVQTSWCRHSLSKHVLTLFNTLHAQTCTETHFLCFSPEGRRECVEDKLILS